VGMCTPLAPGARPRAGCVCDGRSAECLPPDAPPPDVSVDVPLDRPSDVVGDVPIDVVVDAPDAIADVAPDLVVDRPDAAVGDVCEGWRCGRELRLDGRAGPLGGCGCRTTLPSGRSRWLPVLLALSALRAARRRRGAGARGISA
jgi:hypothetical protein